MSPSSATLTSHFRSGILGITTNTKYADGIALFSGAPCYSENRSALTDRENLPNWNRRTRTS